MRETIVLNQLAKVAENAWERMRGLIGRPPPPPGTGFLIPHCNCIHTFFMAYPIDVTFLGHDGTVVKVVRNVRPWRPWIWGGWRAVAAFETACRSFV